ncbi:MAG TPA: hypothetical protein VEW05_26145 [Candidatus Polarisedimenticolia bacterium]|nr:hypothetical protein [Candidatus Polarisedimenticolia bacterium]
MSALPSGSGVAARLAPAKPKTRGFLHIVRHGAGPHAIYVVTYHRLGHDGPSAVDTNPGHREHASLPSASFPSAPIEANAASTPPKPALAEGAQALIELLERIGVDFRLGDVRGALEDILRLGSANIPDLWLSDEEMLEKGLVES